MDESEKPQVVTPVTDEQKIEKPAEGVLNPIIKNLLDTGPNSNYNLRQIQLAAERFGPSHPHDTMDKGLMSDVVKAWNNSAYRDGWHNLVNDASFKTHNRFLGSVANVTLEDLDEYIRTNELPK